MYDVKHLKRIVNEGVVFLEKSQQPSGNFLSLSSPNGRFEKSVSFHSVFSTTLISQMLSGLAKSPRVTQINDKAILFLNSQRSSNYTWNYWVRNSMEAKTLPYPDDLDDTFCALTSIFLHSAKSISGKVLAKVVNMLTALEVKEGGPYKTWLVDNKADKAWKDVDLGVNANIAYFLNLQGIDLPSLTNLFDQAINKDKFTTPYYPSPYPVIYFLSRFLKGKTRKERFLKLINRYQPTNALDLSLKINSLVNLGFNHNIHTMVEKLISMRLKSGSWKSQTFYTGVNPKGNGKFYAGSAALTTAFCLKAIDSFLKISQANIKAKVRKVPEDYSLIHKSILSKVKRRFKQLGNNLSTQSDKYMRQIVRNDKDKQVTLLPFFFKKSLSKNKLDDKFIINLGAASVYGWIAYTIYDNFLDEEADTSSLPFANVCLRELTYIFTKTLPENKKFQSIFRKLIDKQEEANSWEVNNCRFEKNSRLNSIQIPNYLDYKYLADRSIGHSLGCIAILIKLKRNKDVNCLLRFFHHFLIARQLNDDAHDWESDLKKGQVNSVGAMILKEKRENLETIFWQKIVDEVCKLIEYHSKKAIESLLSIKIIVHPEYLLKLVKKQQSIVSIIQDQKRTAVSFIKNYSET